MNTIQELKDAIKNQKFMVWLDPDAEDGNDYIVSYISDLSSIEDWDEETPISIQYNKGESEAEVMLSELHEVLTVEEFMARHGSGYENLEELQEENAVWDYPIEELGYYLETNESEPAFILLEGEVRIIETP